MEKFSDAAIPEALYHRLEQLGIVTPTPIQVQAIPPALEGHDILGTAQTGTGKTAAYGVPLITHLMNNPEGHDTALVLLPTRELAAQVAQALKQFIGNTKISTALLIGGEAMPKQLRQLRTNPRVIVGTPGRVNDHLNRRTLKLHNTNFFVLDEVDRMLDMGFGIQLDEIAHYMTSEKRQTLMFSATLPGNIKKLSGKYLTDPVRVSVGSVHAPAANVKQSHVKLSQSEKQPRLLEELHTRTGSILVFVKTKHGADRMATTLRREGHKADALHGDLRQGKRNRVIQDFRNEKYRILVATDVAARGLDIPHIEHVINFDLPQCPEDYIHRIGRTARAGAEGEALSFLSSAETGKWRAIERLMDPNAKQDDGGDDYRGGGRARKGRRQGGGQYKPRRSEGGGGRGPRRDGGGRSDDRRSNDRGDRRDKPYGGRSDDRRSNDRGDRREGGGRSDDRRSNDRGDRRDKPYGDRNRNEGRSNDRGDRRDKPYGGRSDDRRSNDRPDRREGGGRSDDRRSNDRGDRRDKPYGDRNRNEGRSNDRGDRREGGGRSDDRRSNDRSDRRDKPYGDRNRNEGRSNDRSDRRDDRREGGSDSRGSGNKKPYRNNAEGHSSAGKYSKKKPYKARSDGNSEGRKSRGDKPYGERNSGSNVGGKANDDSGLYRKRKRKSA
ncbi:MAG: DEAD/DEAH box helicase [Alphaproteobacteria bacterium]